MSVDEAIAKRPSYKKVFAAHILAGWVLQKNPKGRQEAKSIDVKVSPPAASAIPPAIEALKAQKRADELQAFGLATRPDACRLWGICSGKPGAESGADRQPGIVHQALWTMMTAVSAARLSASVLMDSRWIRPLLAVINKHCQVLKSAFGQRKASKGDKRSGAELLDFLSRHSAACQDCLEPGRALTAEAAVYLCANLDALYYDLLQYYLWRGGEGPPVPPPHDYFAAIAAKHPGNLTACQGLLNKDISADLRVSMRETWGLMEESGCLNLPPASAAANPLLAVMWARFQEGCRLLPGLDSSPQMNGQPAQDAESTEPAQLQRLCEEEGDPLTESKKRKSGQTTRLGSVPTNFKKQKQSDRYRALLPDSDSNSDAELDGSELGSSESDTDASFINFHGLESSDTKEEKRSKEPKAWPGHPALRAWRESGKECHFYAYAPPTPTALDALAARGPIMEIGAGLGYWAGMLRRRGVKVTAYDSHPPSPQSHAPNEYHGRVPAVSHVTRGGPKALAGHLGQTLFLCYPPLGDSMALDCLQHFRGSCVAVVGEWAGDTGDAAFTAALLEGFSLKEQVPLPNWSDTAHELTVWEQSRGAQAVGKKKSKHGRPVSQNEESSPGLPLAQCAVCNVAHPTSLEGGSPLRRCRWCKDVAYCSAKCAHDDSARHRQLHALRWLPLTNGEPQWGNARDFEPLLL